MYSGLGEDVFAPICPQFCPQAIFHFPEDKKKPRNSLNYGAFLYGGKIGIRTLGTIADTTDFESVPFGHSGIFPWRRA